MKEAKPVQKKTKLQLEQERLGLEEALRLQEQLDEEERKRIARLEHRLQAQERERYFEADKARLLVEIINERKRKFAQQRAEQRRNKPMTQAQQRTYMCNYINHMGSHTLHQLKKLSFDEVKELFETTMKRIGEGSEPAEESKDELSQEQLQQLMIIVLEEGMNVEALQTKYPIMTYLTRDDLVKLWSLVHERFNSTEPTKDKERELWYEVERGCYQMMIYSNGSFIVDEYSVMADELLRKIFILANRPRQ
ncbi:hypothetical protein Tco_1515813 [Tanacetum coccineum]